MNKQVLSFFESNWYKLFNLVCAVGESTHELPHQPPLLSIEPAPKKTKCDSDNQIGNPDIEDEMETDYLENEDEGMFWQITSSACLV